MMYLFSVAASGISQIRQTRKRMHE